MDAKPIRTHRAAYRGLRIPGMAAFFFGATVCAVGSLALVYAFFEYVIFRDNAPNLIWMTVGGAILATVGVIFLGGGLVLLAMSEKMRILDAEKGFDYKKL